MARTGNSTDILIAIVTIWFMPICAQKIYNCHQVYIGETKRMLFSWVAEHCGYVNNMLRDKSTGYHFN